MTLCSCGSSTYRINSYYPADSVDVCTNCNHETNLCICKPVRADILSYKELNRIVNHEKLE